MIPHPEKTHPYDRFGEFLGPTPYINAAVKLGFRGGDKLKDLFKEYRASRNSTTLANPSRREFMEKAAKGTAVAVLAGTAAGKAAKHIDDLPTTPLQSKYKYNDIGEYNKSLQQAAKESADYQVAIRNRLAERKGLPAKDTYTSKEYERWLEDSYSGHARVNEMSYKDIKELQKNGWVDPYTGRQMSRADIKELEPILHEGSPLFKAQMKQYKQDYKSTGLPDSGIWDYLDFYTKPE
jgi:hypothetical protein